MTRTVKKFTVLALCLSAVCALTAPGMLSAQGSGAGKKKGQRAGKAVGRVQNVPHAQSGGSFSNGKSSGSGQTALGAQNYMGQAAAYIKQKDYENAGLEYEKALEAAPPEDARNRSYIYERQGWLALMDGDITGAKELYLLSIDEAEQGEVVNQNLVKSYRGLAFCYEKTEDFTPAMESYKKALKLSHDNSVKSEIRKKMKQLELKSKAAVRN